MLVTALALVLAANGPLCQKFCDTQKYEDRITSCQGTAEELEKDVAFCKAAYVRLRDSKANMEQFYAQKTWDLENKLASCQAKKKAPKKKVVPPVVVVKEETKPCCQVAQPVTVVNNVTVNAGAAAAAAATVDDGVSLWKRERPNWLLGLRGAGGTAFCAPAGIGLVGLRANYLPIHLGVDVYTSFYHGTGAQLLVYPIQSRIAMWHINGGAVWFNQRPFLLPNFPRQVDLTLGTGLELRVLPFLWVTADLQVRMPNPIAIAGTGEQFSTVFGKSLVQTQGMLGLMLRTW